MMRQILEDQQQEQVKQQSNQMKEQLVQP